ncbi:MAG: O-antigen ligase family protein [Candidatus Omnitrophica bacterium]|nr:O-antigen ligase family protein [Candidatus Omnitrophota bacterium]
MSYAGREKILILSIFLFCIILAKIITETSYLVPLMIIISITGFLIAFTHTHMAMIFLIFSMLLSPELIVGSVTKRDIVIRIDDLLILVFSLAWIARSAINKNLTIITKTPINRFIAFYCFMFSLSTINGILFETVSPFKGIFYILKYIEYYFIFYLAAGILKNKPQMKTYIKAIIITYAIVNIYAFLQIGTHGRVSAPFEGKVGEPNTLGGYQVLILGIIIGLLTHTTFSPKWKWTLILVALFSLIPFAYTLSRSAYMSIIPMYFTLIFFNKSKKRNILIGILIICVIVSIFFFPQNIKDRIKYTFIPHPQEHIEPVKFLGVSLGPSASARIQDWIRVYKKWQNKPFLGYGVTGMGFLDSQFIRTFVELGLLGFFAFCALLLSIGYHTLKIYKTTKDPFYKGLSLGFFAAHLGMIAHAITANTYIIIRIMEPYWFLAAMVMCIPRLEARHQQALIMNQEQAQLEDDEEGVPLLKKPNYNIAHLLNYSNVKHKDHHY